MVKFNLVFTRKNTFRYCLYTAILKTRIQRVFAALYCACMAALFVSGFVYVAVTRMTIGLLLSGAAVFIMILTSAGGYHLLRVISKKLTEVNVAADKMEAQLNAREILIIKNLRPVGRIAWDNISEICEYKDDYYLHTTEGVPIIFEKSQITSGTVSDAKTLFNEKNAVLRERQERDKNAKKE